jgi:DNA invertase Pin-like site-specific DNA recombinase
LDITLAALQSWLMAEHAVRLISGAMWSAVDRLARSTRDLILTRSHDRLMRIVFGGLAEFERELLRVRTGEGRARAKARGAKPGRRRIPRTRSARNLSAASAATRRSRRSAAATT